MKSISLKKNAILNAIKQILKIAFPLITFPYVSRVLLEDNFGKYNFSLSIISYFQLIAGLGISSYAIREGARIRDDKKRFRAFADQIFTINIVTTIIAYVALFLTIVFWNKLHSYVCLLIIQSATILFTTLGADWVNSIYEDYEYMTKRYIFVKLISLVLIFTLVKTHHDYIKYTLIIVGSEVLADILNIVYIRRYIKLKLSKRLHLKEHLAPLLMLFANTLAITIYSNADITMLGTMQNDSVVGIYSVASKIYQIAKNLINAVITVMIPRLAAYLGSDDIEKYDRLANKTIICNLTVTIPFSVGMFLLRKEIILLLGGSNYISGNVALAILSFALIPASITSVLSDGVLITSRREKYSLIATVESAVTNIILNIFFIKHMSLNGAAITTLIAELIACVSTFYYSKDLIKVRVQINNNSISVIVGTFVMAALCYFVALYFNGLAKIIISSLIGSLGYFLILIIFKNTLALELLNMLKKKVVKNK